MRKFTNTYLFSFIIIIAFIFTSCKDDSYLKTPPVIPDQSFVEEFDTVSSAFKRGWKPINRSVPIGSGVWGQGSGIPAYSSKSTSTGFIGVNFNSSGLIEAGVTKPSIINNWLVSPNIMMQNGDKIVFYTRTTPQVAPNEFADRLEVRVNPWNNSMNVGRGSGDRTEVGDFTIALLTINNSLALNGPTSYPRDWTKFICTVSGLSAPTSSRFAFRYHMENAGPAGSNVNGNYIGVDSVAYLSIKN